MRVLLFAALAAAAAAMKPPPLPGLPNPDLVGREADYGHFSQLVATVLLLREGGVDRALDAIPTLHDETHAYVTAAALMAAHPEKYNVSTWKGLSAKQAAVVAGKNVTVVQAEMDKWGDAVAAKLNATGKLAWDASADPKANKTTALMQAIGDKLSPDTDQAFIDTLNAKLSQYNIVVTGKSIAQPSKFSNEAAAIARSITGLSLSAQAVNFAPCLVSWSNTGLEASLTGINVQPEAFVVANRGAAIIPTAVNLQPGLLLINPVGFSVQPQAFQVAPFLIAVAPVGYNNQPQGWNVAPDDIVVGPTGVAIGPGGKAVSPIGTAYAPVDIDLAATPSSDDDAPPVAGRRLLGADGAEHEVTIMEDPLDLSNEMPDDYRNWAAVLSQVLLQKEASGTAAATALGRVMLEARGHLAKLAAGDDFLPRFHLTDPAFLHSADGGDGGKAAGLPPISATKFASGGSFVRFAPCVLSESTTGADLSAVGLNIIPKLISIRNTLVDIEPGLVNIQPQLIYLNSIGLSVQPQGFSVQPGLLYFGAIGANFQPQGANVQPQGITVAPVGYNYQPQGVVVSPIRKLIAPTHISYTPKKETVGGVAMDLSDADGQAKAAALAAEGWGAKKG